VGRDYTMTVREAAEFVHSIGQYVLAEDPPVVKDWRAMYAEAITLLGMALKTKGQN